MSKPDDPEDLAGDTPDNAIGWGPGFLRGFDVGVSRFSDALRARLLDDDFRDAGWTVAHVESFVAEVIQRAERVQRRGRVKTRGY